ncbi:LamG domain-containing protein [Corallincola spongiicola]|uniref:LamG domain-containing protein n=1 Tax=Corallincola spongiicola TaxID=2520508 RepID=A0ABY1WND3_9GAMM|nr:LamG domain-containing protein [Corallincola spongiicola]TAA44980.1 LamG domain-containing protein [Corallincola spongiicola]
MKQLLVLFATTLLLTACGGGGDTETLPPSNQQPTDGNYSGPAPATSDVQQFKINLWDNLEADNRCGACHTNDQSPRFVRDDDVNLAYTEANTVVDLDSPADSRLVIKVGQGHNCWLDSDTACAATMTQWISNWAGDSIGGGGNEIVFTDPVIREPGSSKSFPLEADNYVNTIYPIVREYCVQCHSDEAAIPQSPFFASADTMTAYEAAKSKIDLDSAGRSRLVVRLSSEFHNCWSNCASNADEMEAAIQAFSDAIDITEIDPALVLSKSLRLTDGIVASSGGRFEDNVIALYQFKTGEGRTAYDTSGIEPAANMTISGDVEWLGGWGLMINSGKAQASTASSKKLHSLITATGEYSIEGWFAPANVTQEGPARIVSYSAGTTERNFTLGQTLYNYDFLNRSSTTDSNGEPALSTPDADEILQATLQHVVVTFDPVNGRQIYVNGELIPLTDSEAGSTLASWDDSYALVLGNEVSGDRQWAGSVRMLAIYNRILTAEQVEQNFDAGVGEKFFLLFSVGELLDQPEDNALEDGTPSTYVVFEVSQFDNFSYLFSSPFMIDLDGNALTDNLQIEGLRLGINGKEAAVGQTYGNMQLTLNAGTSLAEAQTLSPLGALVGLEKGPESDEFFLTFERFGNHENVFIEPIPNAPSAPSDLPERSDIGMRNFAEINASMSVMTGVATTAGNIQNTYLTVQQQLPSVVDIETFLSSHQMAVTQLAIQYCDVLVEDPTLSSNFFPGFDFNTNAATAFDAAGRSLVIDPLLSNMLGSGITTQPDAADVEAELNNLIDRLTVCQNDSSCDASRTRTVVKASCAAVLGSAAMLLQ